ncbi:hypothetical protein AAFC00_003052 [Neodothiora populina]|uniref:Peptidase A1 domain-containing protein n=1 Tax=Neodothiora populina TaxID=2781224 RepID=A0ABR3P9I4_9PEZI
MLKTYARYSAAPPTDVKVAAQSAEQSQQSGTVAAIPQAYDMSYLSPVTIGGQSLNLDFDTGSADLWVFSDKLSASDRGTHDYYNTSSATQMAGQQWGIGYGDGSSARGIVYADKVVVGQVTATSQAVEAATSVSSQFVSDTHNDGLLGLAFSTINTVRPNQQTTFFDSVKSSLAQPLFTVDLKKGQAGSYDFGFIDSSKYTGEISYVNVDSSGGFWRFTADGWAVGAAKSFNKTSFTAIADTGTSLMYLPQASVDAYYNSISGASYNAQVGGYIYPCNADAPSFHIIIGGSAFTVPGSYINYAQVSQTMCFGGLQSDSGIGFSILGDVFLKSQFVVFSAPTGATPQLGFGSQSSLIGVDDDFEEWYLECNGADAPPSS